MYFDLDYDQMGRRLFAPMAELPVEIGQVADQLRLALLGRLFREPGIDQGVRLVVVEPIVRAPVERHEQKVT